MLTHELIRKLVLTTEHESMSKQHDERNDCEHNRRKIMHYIKNDKRRNTVNESNTSDDCNMSYLSTKSNNTPIRPRLAVSHSACKYSLI
jgi:hypothetical protein